jgi:SOS response regulatory protein OraA/RecX
MTKRQDVEFGSSSEDAAPESRIAQPPQPLADAMALLKQEVRERKQVEERLHETNEDCAAAR